VRRPRPMPPEPCRPTAAPGDHGPSSPRLRPPRSGSALPPRPAPARELGPTFSPPIRYITVRGLGLGTADRPRPCWRASRPKKTGQSHGAGARACGPPPEPIRLSRTALSPRAFEPLPATVVRPVVLHAPAARSGVEPAYPGRFVETSAPGPAFRAAPGPHGAGHPQPSLRAFLCPATTASAILRAPGGPVSPSCRPAGRAPLCFFLASPIQGNIGRNGPRPRDAVVGPPGQPGGVPGSRPGPQHRLSGAGAATFSRLNALPRRSGGTPSPLGAAHCPVHPW